MYAHAFLGGVPSLSVKKKSIKIGPKTVWFGRKTMFFWRKIPFLAMGRPLRGGGVPPFSVKKSPLTFRENLVRDGPGGGGVPP